MKLFRSSQVVISRTTWEAWLAREAALAEQKAAGLRTYEAGVLVEDPDPDAPGGYLRVIPDRDAGVFRRNIPAEEEAEQAAQLKGQQPAHEQRLWERLWATEGVRVSRGPDRSEDRCWPGIDPADGPFFPGGVVWVGGSTVGMTGGIRLDGGGLILHGLLWLFQSFRFLPEDWRWTRKRDPQHPQQLREWGAAKRLLSEPVEEAAHRGHLEVRWIRETAVPDWRIEKALSRGQEEPRWYRCWATVDLPGGRVFRGRLAGPLVAEFVDRWPERLQTNHGTAWCPRWVFVR